MRNGRTKVSGGVAIGALLGVIGGFTYNPGTITTDELEALRADWLRARDAQRAFSNQAGELDWNLNQGETENLERARELWDGLEPLWEGVEDGLDAFGRDFWDFYRFDAVGELGALDPSTENQVVELIRRARDGWDPSSSSLIVQLPAGELSHFILGLRDRRHEVDCSFLGEATLELRGHPDGTTILPEHDQRGWGVTMTAHSGGLWAGRIHVSDVTLLASGGNTVATLTRWGVITSRTPFKDLRFTRCRFLDHPNQSVDVVRPITCSQAALSLVDCYFDLPNSREHGWYPHNPYNAPTEITGNVVVALGGQVGQYVSRPSEGPSYGRSKVTVSGNVFSGYHRNCDRAATAFTIAGAGLDFEITGNVFHDLNPSGCFGPGKTGGSVVVWNGGTHFTLEGEIVGGKPVDPELAPVGSFSNGAITITDNVFVQANPSRSTLSLSSAESVTVKRNAIVGFDCSVWRDWDPLKGNVGTFVWEENNRPEDLARAEELVPGAPMAQAVGLRLRVDGAAGELITAPLAW